MQCTQCGSQLQLDSRFCGSCGATIVASQPPPAVAVVPAPAPSVRPPPATVRNAAKTMIGVQLDGAVPAAMPIAPPAAPVAPVATPSAPPVGSDGAGPMRVQNASRTMIGVQFDPASLQSAAGAGAPPARPAPIGPAPAGILPPSGAVGPGAVQVSNAQQTMMGLSLPQVGAIAPAPYSPPAMGRSERPPMMGGAMPGSAPEHALNLRMPPPPQFGSPGSSTPGIDSVRTSRPSLGEYDPLGRNKPNRILPIALGLIGLLGLAGGITWFVLRSSDGSSGPAAAGVVSAGVRAGPHDTLVMAFPPGSFPTGTTVRLGSQTQTSAGAEMIFALENLGDRVGTIDMPIDVTPPGAPTVRRTARIVLAYHVAPDLEGLASDPPQLRLIFRVAPGSQLSINGQPANTDPRTGIGTATASSGPPLPPERDALEATFNITVRTPEGATVTGVYPLRVPRTPLTVDRPTSPWITSFDRVVVRARGPGARVATVTGGAAVIAGDRIQAVVPLATVGPQPITLAAYSNVGAPASVRLDVERVRGDVRAATERFLAGSRAGAAEIAAGTLQPPTRVRVTGQVLGDAREHEGGQTFQLVVAHPSCAGGRCVVWVDTPPNGARPDGTRVVVTGAIGGRRTWTTGTGERRTDAVIDAAFVEGGG